MDEGSHLLRQKPEISVIIPIHQKTEHLKRLREFIINSSIKNELILVINNANLINDIVSQHPSEIVIKHLQPGRDFALKSGVQHAHGAILLLLHADSILSPNWDSEIIKQLKDPCIVGGGFSLRFDNSNLFLEYLIKFSTILFKLTGELWGDRAIFVKTPVLRKCISALKVPLFEDIRLSKCMRKQGNIVILNEHIITSAASFQKNGHIIQTLRILVSRLWYALGGDPKTIYNYYYQLIKKDKRAK
jgi:glycosyltransferase involved in cell wall biosynthesis